MAVDWQPTFFFKIPHWMIDLIRPLLRTRIQCNLATMCICVQGQMDVVINLMKKAALVNVVDKPLTSSDDMASLICTLLHLRVVKIS